MAEELLKEEETPEDLDALMEQFIEWSDGPTPTRCPEGCTVEPDGTCPHGYASRLLEMGLI